MNMEVRGGKSGQHVNWPLATTDPEKFLAALVDMEAATAAHMVVWAAHVDQYAPDYVFARAALMQTLEVALTDRFGPRPFVDLRPAVLFGPFAAEIAALLGPASSGQTFARMSASALSGEVLGVFPSRTGLVPLSAALRRLQDAPPTVREVIVGIGPTFIGSVDELFAAAEMLIS